MSASAKENYLNLAQPQLNVGRPVPEAMAEVQQAAAKVNALIDGWKAAGEVTVTIDILKFPAVITLHVPLPKNG